VDGLGRVERGEDGLNGNAAVGDKLTAGTAQRRRDRSRPAVLPHQHGCDGARFHRVGGLFQVVLTEQPGRRAGEIGQAVALLRDLREVPRRDRAVLVLDDESEIEDPDDAAIHKIQQQRHHLAGHRLLTVPLQDHEIDRAHLFKLRVAHDDSCSPEPDGDPRPPACCGRSSAVTSYGSR
jgi:hypothetical protein